MASETGNIFDDDYPWQRYFIAIDGSVALSDAERVSRNELLASDERTTDTIRELHHALAPRGATCPACRRAYYVSTETASMDGCSSWDTHAKVYWCEQCWDLARTIFDGLPEDDDWDEYFIARYGVPLDEALGQLLDKVAATSWDTAIADASAEVWVDPATGITHQQWLTGETCCEKQLWPRTIRVGVTCTACIAGEVA